MTRRNAEWNRSIPERTRVQARPSTLFRSVAQEHVPPDLPTIEDRTHIHHRRGWFDNETAGLTLFDTSYYQAMFDSMTVPPTTMARNSGPTRSFFDMGRRLGQAGTNRGTLVSHGEVRTISNEDLRRARDNMMQGRPSGLDTREINNRISIRAEELDEPFVAPPLQPMQRQARNETTNADLASQTIQTESLGDGGFRITMPTNTAVNVRGDVGTAGMGGGGAAGFTVRNERDPWIRGDLRGTIGRGLTAAEVARMSEGFDGDAVNVASSAASLLSQKHMGAGSSINIHDLRRALKENLDIKIELSDDGSGNIGVKATVLLDGEEICSDSDFVQVYNPNQDDF